MGQRPIPAGRPVRRYHPVDLPVTRPIAQTAGMRRAGGLIGLVAGIFGVLAAIVTLMIDGAGAAFKADRAGEVVALGWFGLLLSFLCIVLGAVAIRAAGQLPELLLIVTACLAAVFGGSMVAICMALALAGGVLAAIPGRKRAIVTLVQPGPPRLGRSEPG